MNIYISLKNEELLRKHNGSMSGLINGLLENYFARGGVSIKEDPVVNIPIKKNSVLTSDSQETPKKIVEPIFNTLKLCGHGAAPQFCKHAQPGKPCKK